MLQVSCRRGSQIRLGSKQDQPQTVPVFIFILDKQRVDSVSSPVESRQKQSQNGKNEARCRGGQQGGDNKYGRILADSARLREPIRARHFQLGKSRLQLFNLTSSSLFFPSFNSSSLVLLSSSYSVLDTGLSRREDLVSRLWVLVQCHASTGPRQPLPLHLSSYHEHTIHTHCFSIEYIVYYTRIGSYKSVA